MCVEDKFAKEQECGVETDMSVLASIVMWWEQLCGVKVGVGDLVLLCALWVFLMVMVPLSSWSTSSHLVSS